MRRRQGNPGYEVMVLDANEREREEKKRNDTIFSYLSLISIEEEEEEIIGLVTRSRRRNRIGKEISIPRENILLQMRTETNEEQIYPSRSLSLSPLLFACI